MAFLPTAKTDEAIKRTPVSDVRKEYSKIAEYYNKIVNHDIIFCKLCGRPLVSKAFYVDTRYADNRSIYCKECLVKIAGNQKTDKDPLQETPESIKNALRLIDKPFINSVYDSAKATVTNGSGERPKESIFAVMVTMLASLPQYRGLTFKDSDVLDSDTANTEFKINRRLVEAGRKRFGDYSEKDLMFLEKEYEDWTLRYPCDSKSQEVLFQRLCCQELAASEIEKKGGSTKDIDKSIQDTMTALGIKPSQSSAEAMADNLTFGQMIEKWEAEKPIPEPDEEFKDVDKVGSYIDIFFKGHLSKSMGLRNVFSAAYDKFMEKFSVKKPEMDDESEEMLFNQIFGSNLTDGD